MPRRPALALAGLVLATVGCGAERASLPPACTLGPEAVERALGGAPASVRLSGGTRLSTCVERALSGAQGQNVGTTYTQVADRLAARVNGSDDAAMRLGYLVGASERGAARTNGVQLELARRLQQAGGVDGAPPAQREAFSRGRAAGLARG